MSESTEDAKDEYSDIASIANLLVKDALGLRVQVTNPMTGRRVIRTICAIKKSMIQVFDNRNVVTWISWAHVRLPRSGLPAETKGSAK